MDRGTEARRHIAGIVRCVTVSIERTPCGITCSATRVTFARQEVNESSLGGSSVEPAEAPSAISREIEHTVVVVGVVALGKGLVDCAAVDLAAHELVANSGGAKLLARAQLIDELDRERAIVDEPDRLEAFKLPLDRERTDLASTEQFGNLCPRLAPPRQSVHADVLGAACISCSARFGLVKLTLFALSFGLSHSGQVGDGGDDFIARGAGLPGSA